MHDDQGVYIYASCIHASCIYASPKFCRGEENEEGKGEKYFESENIFLVEEKKKREGKGGKYLEKEKNFYLEEKKYAEGKGGQYHGEEKIGAGRDRNLRLQKMSSRT